MKEFLLYLALFDHRNKILKDFSSETPSLLENFWCFGDGILLSIVLKMDFTENTFGRSRLDMGLLSNDQWAHKK